MDLRDPTILRKINNATRYPSIPTYHKLDEKGILTEARNIEFVGQILGTEKINGVNSRIILPPMEWGNIEWLLGSRQEILHAAGDLIYNPAVQIVDTLRPWLSIESNTDKLAELDDQYTWECATGCSDPACAEASHKYFIVLYLECFGGRQQTNSWRQYSKTGEPSFRLFDIALIPTDVIGRDDAVIAMWRDSHQQTWLDNDQLLQAGHDLDIPVAPRVFDVPAKEWPTDLQGVYDHMIKVSNKISYMTLPEGARRQMEGFVIRTPSSNKIAKIRFYDYERALGEKP